MHAENCKGTKTSLKNNHAGDGTGNCLQFWDTADKWKKWSKSWLEDRFNTLDSEQVEKDVMNSYKTMFKMGKAFQLRNLDKCSDNCNKIRDEVEVFKKYTPLVSALRAPGMRERHWDQLSEQIGMDLHPDDTFTLQGGLDMGLLEHLEAITKVSDVAMKEYSIETTLDKMQAEWKEQVSTC